MSQDIVFHNIEERQHEYAPLGAATASLKRLSMVLSTLPGYYLLSCPEGPQ
ncbi:MAG TPA: hypothetical protein V6D20_11105 [Candidatus Obscuribacterales bacterium]